MTLPTGDNVNYFQDSRAVAVYYGVGFGAQGERCI